MMEKRAYASVFFCLFLLNVKNLYSQNFFEKQIFKKKEETILEELKPIIRSENLNEHYIQKLLRYNVPVADILEKARNRKKYDLWSEKKINKLDDDFTKKIQSLNLQKELSLKLNKVYGLCVQSYGQDEDRIFMRKIEISDPLPQYTKIPEFTPIEDPYLRKEWSIDPKSSCYEHETKESKGFYLLMAYAQKAQRDYLLDDFQSACMAKCIADEALTYVPLSQNPFTAVRSFLRSEIRSDVKIFENPYGVCTNYAKLTYYVALALGFGERVQVQREGKHFFNQFYIDHSWYHFHPLRKYGKECRFIPYKKHDF